MELRICTICKKGKPASEYNKKSNRKDGLQTHCRECNRESARRYYADNREKHIGESKKTRQARRRDNHAKMIEFLSQQQCADCGFSHILVLEFDHLKDKRANISRMLCTYPWATILLEIEKCDIVCRNCHAIRTHQRQDSYRNKAILG